MNDNRNVANNLKPLHISYFEKIRECYEHFVNSDDGDGKLTKDEFHNFAKKVFKNKNVDRVKTDEIFGTFDTNNDGMVTFREFIWVAIAISNDDLNVMLNHAFYMLDTSGDGFLTLDEFKDFIRKILSIRMGPEMVRQVDINGFSIETFQKCGLDPTQKISKEQFIEGCKKNKELIKWFTGEE
ncbi:unnamed protein product [Adineta ricciae]|uniref:EF-hand domain-containing protein n=1 Tax=Adineta ricciae TaxID=249248 RepID=A0A815KZQ7_ADIRI|nr:unnamed protein product [Adineta ricciae]